MVKKMNFGVIKKDGKYALVSTTTVSPKKISECENLKVIVEGLDYIDSSEIKNMVKKYGNSDNNA